MADMNDAATIWAEAKRLLLANASLSERYRTCVSGLKPFVCFDDMLVLEAPDELTRLTIETRVNKEVLQALQIASGRRMTFVIRIASEAPQKPAETTTPDDTNDAITIAYQAQQRNHPSTTQNIGTPQTAGVSQTAGADQRPRQTRGASQHRQPQADLFDLQAAEDAAARRNPVYPTYPADTAANQAATNQTNMAQPVAPMPQTPAMPVSTVPVSAAPASAAPANPANAATGASSAFAQGAGANPAAGAGYEYPSYSATPSYPNAPLPVTGPNEAPLPQHADAFAAQRAAVTADSQATARQAEAQAQAIAGASNAGEASNGAASANGATPADGAQGAKQQLGMADSQTNRDEETHLNKKATFDTFVAGDSNRFAHAVAVAVAEAPGKNFNPLCIYGGPGLGKTHLLNAIGNEALRENPSLRVRYANSEEFTNEFIEAVRNSANDPNVVANFNRRYREVDILLIDDIQFLRGEETMRQFFHTFNALHQANKQIVIASDVAPKNLKGFEQRLISRFDSGLSVDVRPPDLETRIAILRMKAQNSGMEVPNDVLTLIAEQVTDNVRELEGALTRVHAMASLNRQPLTRALAEQTLQDFFSSDVEITPTDIITTTAQYFQLTFDDLVGTSRTKNIAMARQIAMYMTREMTNLSLVDVGEIFGGRDHSTVMHACKKISSEMSEKREVYNYVKELTVMIKRKDSSK
ncbi:chromosomal replication initiator protein DnaA [Pseudoscardovia radai]|uniref:Chromosomal replication initiator protein DnaA n=2 Tax=Pseudoscardovia radai TaxID=987066 RepID=A0A261EUP3_9BIFI|nr:chromosomal replication initiator protein DnaA [Pseudoscardovia radai]